MKKLLTVLAIGTSVLFGSSSPHLAVAAQEEDRPKSLTKPLTSNLALYPPVYVYGPYPYKLYTAHKGDLVQLQISYPVSPPHPELVTVTSSTNALLPLDIVNTGGRVAILKPNKPMQGLYGVGHFSVFLRAARNGDASVTVKVKFSDGSVEEVPFQCRIGEERKSVRHGLGGQVPDLSPSDE
jgi:hypothetical protein